MNEAAITKLVQAARRVVWAWYYDGDDTWQQLTEAIEELEQIVGQPKNKSDI